jgi:CheY-like chemotaxis protein
VLACTNGLEAVTRLDQFRPDAVLLDIMMPQMDGFETLRVIRRLAPTVHTKIIVFSNLSGDEHVQRCRGLGADGFIVKADMTPAEVYGEVEKLITA